MEFLAPLLEVIKCFGRPTSQYVNYHRKLEENINDLKRKVNDLNIRKQDLELKKDKEIRCRKVVKNEVENWFENVRSINVEMEKIEMKFCVVSYFSRASLGKLIRRKIAEVERIYQQGSFPEGVAVDGPPASGVTFPTTDLEGQIGVKGRIWEYLMDNEVGMIGICGMGGIGKTTIMKNINNQLLKENQFDAVIWMTVSREFNIVRLQEDLAHALDYSLPKNKLEWPTVLMEILERKRYVLILDDVWEPFALLDVGIPEPSSHNGSKLVITSRSVEVCNTMGCKVFKVQPLSPEASLNLFSCQVGDNVLQDPTLKELVDLIVVQCGGLPLAIMTIASSMKGVEDAFEWRNALCELRERVTSVKGSDTIIFEQLKFSYDRLKDSKIQNCFLYCSLYPEDHHFEKEELIENWIDEELIDELENRRAMHDRGHTILNKLVNNCLLEKVMIDDVERGVKMHDVVRDMALSIKRCDNIMVKAGMQLEEIPSEHKWKESLEKVSLMNNSIPGAILISPKCHNLSTLLLQRNLNLGKILGSFFENMHGLKVLNLSHTGISDLPNSISNLKNLTALVLRWCHQLRYMPSLTKLTALKKLDLFHTKIKEVPHGMEMLENLTYLNLYSRDLKDLPMGMLARFSNLQVMKAWLNIKGEEVAKLRKLEILLGAFCDMQDFEGYAKSLLGKGPTNYWLGVGSPTSSYFENHPWFANLENVEVNKEVCFIHCKMGNEAFVFLPKDIRTLTVESCRNIRSLSNFSLFCEANEVKICTIRWCEDVECVVDLSLSSCNSLQNVEVLHLRSLRNLCELLRGVTAVASTSHTPAPPAIFSSLKKFYLVGCPSIKKLFAVHQLQGFQNLEHVEVKYCKRLEKIIAEEEGENQTVVKWDSETTFAFPKLNTLHLIKLPELKSICDSGLRIPAESLRYLSIINCSKLKKIPFSIPLLETGQPSPLSLEYGYVHPRIWWKLVEFDDLNAKDVLSPLVLDYSSEEDEE
ncbi:S-locus lectin protein kinase family protein [Hibiscus syriacus]|uniref:S-locus lectin protein kinase family protein n=1 Tax=Hibiscus syriacus TaxID=106335 RepID=A0A6A3AJY4_HIBSY|nr:probable disease resistance protein At1g61300 [Hibiscus syriacus]KAE8703209.1 S-locus lectin protein kinase family protein [Hibiscus syriacus]